MEQSEIHIFILWQNARDQESRILDDMSQRFSILKLYDITWTPELVASNFTRFYGVNLPKNSYKEKECGIGSFLLCIVRDENPIYEVRETSHGYESVNKNMFDAKLLYRSWTKGGHKVHGTTNPKETIHDLTLLLGMNVDDFLNYTLQSVHDKNIEHINKDLEGANGWESLEKLFYVLNNTVRYVTLRGYGELSSGVYIDHTDTDILTDDYYNLWQIVNAKGFRSIVRPKAGVDIGEVRYYLDIWDASKGYFDPSWTKSMLSTYVMWNGMRILSPENDFYCLLYHCLTNKGRIAEDYIPKLEKYKKQFGIIKNDWNEILVDYLSAHQYDVTVHKDPSNPFNISNPIVSRYIHNTGLCVQAVNIDRFDMHTKESLSWKCKVYKKEKSYIKKGSEWLIKNEVEKLNRLSDINYFPKVLNKGMDEESYWMEMTRMPGITIDNFYFFKRKNLNIKNISFHIVETLKAVKIIYDHGIIHRDIRPENILVDPITKNISIIDFGFASNFPNIDTPTPHLLNVLFSPKDSHSDFFSIGSCLYAQYGQWPYIKKIADVLKEIDWSKYEDREFVERKYNEAIKLAEPSNVDIKTLLLLYKHKYSNLKIYIRSPRKLLEFIKNHF